MAADERELAARLRGDEAGAQGAFDAIFRESYERLVRVAGAIVHDQGTAEELVQDVMLELWRRRRDVNLAGPPIGYLIRSTRNRALNVLRHQRITERAAQISPPDESTDADAPSELEGEELDALIQRTLAALPPRCVEVFLLSRRDGLRYAEIATQLGISVKTVEAHMTRALREFRERLAAWL